MQMVRQAPCLGESDRCRGDFRQTGCGLERRADVKCVQPEQDDYENRQLMKTIGLIGGMSWESTIPYYREINATIKARLGGLHSAKLILYSVDFHEIERLQHAGDWDAAGTLLAHAANALETAGADFLVLATNTMHKVAPAIEAAVKIPLLHIADATADEIERAGYTTVGLLGTRFTMEQAFYKDRLSESHGLAVLTSDAADRDIVHRVIYDELCLGKIQDSSRAEFRRIMASLIARGAQAIILGCTEIGLLVGSADCAVPQFDTAAIHARRAAEAALA
jgi:aspartate racemase